MFENLKRKSQIKKQIKNKLKKEYEELMYEQKEKNKLLSCSSDWAMLESFIVKCNQNPNLKVDINLKDGTIIHMRCYEPSKKRDFNYIDGEEYIEVK